MSMRTKLAAPFAHLLGLGASAEEDEDKTKKGRRAEDGGDDDDKDKDGKARRAEDDKEKDGDEKEGRAEGDDDKEKDDDKSGRRAKSRAEDDEDMDDDEDDEEEMRGNSAAAKSRRRERARCAAIFGCKAAGARPDVAATLAFSTTMSRREAIAVLTSTATSTEPRRRGLDERMASLRTPAAGVDGGASAPAGMTPVAAAIVAAGEKARGK
ncbi:hypothetical protein [Luteibacter yeojuensis]|uniref:Uncharacterized protein n=1 Tax=Luteibacter yeojuensis TaxID=345309 RepID=A0A7X5QU43_9GAMM|nr:hypothetical protein [Luteibacter yeojuensis]NID15389.1 hypothetical protein [Luteibacter yeojuensis]